jgi:hypothetical protein
MAHGAASLHAYYPIGPYTLPPTGVGGAPGSAALGMVGDDRVVVSIRQLRDSAAVVEELQDQLRLTERERYVNGGAVWCSCLR